MRRHRDGTETACLFGYDFCSHYVCENDYNERKAKIGPECARRPHVHRNVYFASPAEHNRKLLEGARRALAQLIERTEWGIGKIEQAEYRARKAEILIIEAMKIMEGVE